MGSTNETHYKRCINKSLQGLALNSMEIENKSTYISSILYTHTQRKTHTHFPHVK